MRRFLAPLIVAIALLATIPVLAQDQGTPTTTPSPACASPAAGTPTVAAAVSPSASPTACGEFTVTMIDINFNPKELTIPANTDVTVSLPNTGATAHDFNIDELNIHSGEIAPGQTGSVTINAAPGDYQYYCNIPGHKEAGMVGTLHVQ
jgi:nitrite reductase (NO-forming)